MGAGWFLKKVNEPGELRSKVVTAKIAPKMPLLNKTTVGGN